MRCAAAGGCGGAVTRGESRVSRGLDWSVDGRDWPHRAASRFVRAGGLSWHVQVMGSGPAVLLLHGTGASTHSWRGVAPLLADRFTVVIPDLPGHGFTGSPDAAQMSLPGMARLVTALLHALGLAPAVIVGHSAGAAIAMRISVEERVRPEAIVSVNGALLKLQGAGVLFPAIARVLAATPVAWIFSRQASQPGTVDRLLAGSGSRVDPQDARWYARLFSDPSHVAGALGMMSRWDLGALDLARVSVPVTLVVGSNDRMIAPADATRAAARLPDGRVVTLPGLGHLAHEEDPERLAHLIADAADAAAPARRAVA